MGLDRNANQSIAISLVYEEQVIHAYAHVYEDEHEITEDVPELAFYWYRHSNDHGGDEKWNMSAAHRGVNHIAIPKNDINGSWLLECVCNEAAIYGNFLIDNAELILKRPYGIEDEFELSVDDESADCGHLYASDAKYSLNNDYCVCVETVTYYLKTEVTIMSVLKDNFVIDRAVECWMRDFATQLIDWSVNQIENFTWNIDVDTQDVNDAQGNRIMQFERAKSARFNFDVSIPNAKLIANQFGTTLKVATSTNTIKMPYVQEFTWVNGESVALDHTPVGTSGAEIPVIYALNADGSLGTQYLPDSAAGAGKYKVNAEGKTVTPPTDVTTATRARAYYDYIADGTEGNEGSMIDANADNHTKTGEFNARFIVHDVCDETVVNTAYIRAERAKINGTVEQTLTADGKASVEITVNKAYCGDGGLFKVYFD